MHQLNFLNSDSELVKIENNLNDYVDRDYGVVFDVPVFVIERVLKLNNGPQQYKLRKILTYLVFVAGLYSLFNIITRRFDNYKLGLLGVVIILLSPRIFGESFYNSKDIVFMAIFTIALNRMFIFINSPSKKNAFYLGLITALDIDTRIIGLVFPIITASLIILNIFCKESATQYFFKPLILYIVTFLFYNTLMALAME